MWHAQATLMLLEQEEPVWMLCSYAWLLYTPTALVLTAGEMTSAPLFSALLATLLFYPVDIVGAKHLWWTWHNSDPLYEERDRFMPYASPLYAFPSSSYLAQYEVEGSHAMLTTCCQGREEVLRSGEELLRHASPERLRRSALECADARKSPEWPVLLFLLCAFPRPSLIPAVQALMVLLYHAPKSMTAETEAPWGMRDGYRTFKLLCLAAASLELLIWGIKGRLSWSFPRLVQGEPVVLVYAAWTVVLAMIGAGILVKSQELEIFGLHQTIGDCEERESCFWGQAERYTYACVEEDFHRQNSGLFLFNCTEELPAAGTSWYTICGTKKKSQWIADLVFDGLLALAVVFIIGGLKLRTVSPGVGERRTEPGAPSIGKFAGCVTGGLDALDIGLSYGLVAGKSSGKAPPATRMLWPYPGAAFRHVDDLADPARGLNLQLTRTSSWLSARVTGCGPHSSMADPDKGVARAAPWVSRLVSFSPTRCSASVS
eukprot:scaffold3031_cov285-Pinguiococcus_pyrenoidosus.AAC.8